MQIGQSVFLASLPSLVLRFQPHSRPFVWQFVCTWIRKNTDCSAVYLQCKIKKVRNIKIYVLKKKNNLKTYEIKMDCMLV